MRAEWEAATGQQPAVCRATLFTVQIKHMKTNMRSRGPSKLEGSAYKTGTDTERARERERERHTPLRIANTHTHTTRTQCTTNQNTHTVLFAQVEPQSDEEDPVQSHPGRRVARIGSRRLRGGPPRRVAEGAPSFDPNKLSVGHRKPSELFLLSLNLRLETPGLAFSLMLAHGPSILSLIRSGEGRAGRGAQSRGAGPTGASCQKGLSFVQGTSPRLVFLAALL